MLFGGGSGGLVSWWVKASVERAWKDRARELDAKVAEQVKETEQLRAHSLGLEAERLTELRRRSGRRLALRSPLRFAAWSGAPLPFSRTTPRGLVIDPTAAGISRDSTTGKRSRTRFAKRGRCWGKPTSTYLRRGAGLYSKRSARLSTSTTPKTPTSYPPYNGLGEVRRKNCDGLCSDRSSMENLRDLTPGARTLPPDLSRRPTCQQPPDRAVTPPGAATGPALGVEGLGHAAQ